MRPLVLEPSDAARLRARSVRPGGALKHSHQVIEDLLAEGRIPSIQVAVYEEGKCLLERAGGLARIVPRQPANLLTPYDLASVTKPIAGATVAAALVQEGRLDLDAPVADVLSDIDQQVTARHLLHHSSGLPAWAALYEGVPRALWGSPEARQQILAMARRTPVCAVPGEASVYSDLGFLVLCELLETVGHASIEALTQERVLTPAQIDLRWGWPGAAATEDCPVRGEVVQGQVHDLNAFAMGGRSTHAGLFGCASDLARFGAALMQSGAGLPDMAPFWACKGPGSHVLGWDGVTTGGYTSTGSRWPTDGVGHLGYTGTSLWLAPRQRVAVAVLTNRVHPLDEKTAIREARPRIHDAVARDLGW